MAISTMPGSLVVPASAGGCCSLSFDCPTATAVAGRGTWPSLVDDRGWFSTIVSCSCASRAQHHQKLEVGKYFSQTLPPLCCMFLPLLRLKDLGKECPTIAQAESSATIYSLKYLTTLVVVLTSFLVVSDTPSVSSRCVCAPCCRASSAEAASLPQGCTAFPPLAHAASQLE